MTPKNLKEMQKLLGFDAARLAAEMGTVKGVVNGWRSGRIKMNSIEEKSLRNLFALKFYLSVDRFRECPWCGVSESYMESCEEEKDP
jgi:hypothetical protein